MNVTIHSSNRSLLTSCYMPLRTVCVWGGMVFRKRHYSKTSADEQGGGEDIQESGESKRKGPVAGVWGGVWYAGSRGSASLRPKPSNVSLRCKLTSHSSMPIGLMFR